MSRAMEREYQPCLISRCPQSKSNNYLSGRNRRAFLGLEASGTEDAANYESNHRESTVYQVEALWLQFD